MTQKREVLLHLTGGVPSSVIFEERSGMGPSDLYLDFLRKDWDDMGRPEVITVTIQPGDRLNPPYDPRRGE